MKLLVEPCCDEINFNCDGLILPLISFATESIKYYTLDEISAISSKFKGEIFVKMNKNFMNKDIKDLKRILPLLDKMKITGIFFYDLALLQLKKELNLDVNLVWNQTHMVNNYKTCNYYFSRGVKYALLGKEITLDEILTIIKKSDITCMVEVVSRPSVAFSKRKLITNYCKNIGISKINFLKIKERVSNLDFDLVEDNNGCSIFLDTITNGTSIIKDLYLNGCSYIIMREYGIDNFYELVQDTIKYISSGCSDDNYIIKYKRLGDSTNFFFKKTIYRVKKNG